MVADEVLAAGVHAAFGSGGAIAQWILPTLERGLARCYPRLPMEPKNYTIGQLAREVGVPVSTVRFYERARLLVPDTRTQGNYRLYGPAALERLRFIRAAQASGFTLDDIAVLLAFRDGTKAPNKKVQALILDRLADVERRVEELGRVRAVLRASLHACRSAERKGRCAVIEGLDRVPSRRRGGRS